MYTAARYVCTSASSPPLNNKSNKTIHIDLTSFNWISFSSENVSSIDWHFSKMVFVYLYLGPHIIHTYLDILFNHQFTMPYTHKKYSFTHIHLRKTHTELNALLLNVFGAFHCQFVETIHPHIQWPKCRRRLLLLLPFQMVRITFALSVFWFWTQSVSLFSFRTNEGRKKENKKRFRKNKPSYIWFKSLIFVWLTFMMDVYIYFLHKLVLMRDMKF